MHRIVRAAAVLWICGLVAACASAPSDSQNDPYESTNRDVFALNQQMDKHIARPAAVFYVHAVPEPARTAVHNVLYNLGMPLTFVNDVLQGEATRSLQTFTRFAMNTTLGVGGMIDVASQGGIPKHTEDFGQTLAVYGVGEGPFLMLPLVGPDNPRDLTGQFVDIALDPFTYVRFRNDIFWDGTRAVLDIVDTRAQNLQTFDAIEQSSIDVYAAVRSLYRQNRENEIRNGVPDLDNLPNF